MENENVFNSKLASDIYEAYTNFFLTPNFSNLNAADMANHVADCLEKKGYKMSDVDEGTKVDVVERVVTAEMEFYDIMRGCIVKRIKFNDGSYTDVLKD